MMVAEKVSVITGATGALGAVTSRRFRAEGGRLALCGASPGGVEALRREYAGDAFLVERADLTRAADVQGLVKRVLATFGRIDILLNLAGGYRGGVAVTEMAEDDLEFSLALNLTSAFLMCRAVVPHMIAQGWGRVVNVGARAGLQGRAGASAHAVSKGGVIRLTESLAEEVRDHGVTVNVVIPSTLDTPANRRAWPDADFTKWVPPEDVAETILFLCSEEARSISGARIPVFNRA